MWHSCWVWITVSSSYPALVLMMTPRSRCLLCPGPWSAGGWSVLTECQWSEAGAAEDAGPGWPRRMGHHWSPLSSASHRPMAGTHTIISLSEKTRINTMLCSVHGHFSRSSSLLVQIFRRQCIMQMP